MAEYMNRVCVLLLTLILLAGDLLAADRIVILGLFRDQAVLEIDGKRHTLSAGMSTQDGVKLISANSREAILEINGNRQSYTLGTRIGSRFSPAEPGTTVSIAPDNQGMYWVNGSINNHQVKFIVDTGATLITMNRHVAKRIGIDYTEEGKKSVSSTASGLEPVYVVELDTVTVGDIQLQNVPAAVHDSDFPMTILLGNSFLNNISIRRDGRLLQLIR